MLGRVVVVGASLAGLRAAETLRSEGFDGEVVLIGAETQLPYDRPPLSKRVLSGEWEPDRIALRKPDSWYDLRFDLRLGVRASALDVEGRRVELADGSHVAYDGLIIATGATPRTLPMVASHVEGLHVLRTLDDSLALRERFAREPKVVVVGAGFIGSEVAACANGYGLDVTVVEALPVPLVRGLGPEMGRICAELHADHGVPVRLGVGVEDVEIAGGAVVGVRLADGTRLEADVVVVGVGVAPETRWLEGSGLELRDGVVCDAFCAAGPPGVYAAGDLARWPHELYGEQVRIEHWTNAAEQGAAAARNLLAGPGNGTPFAPVPFVWSDQYKDRIQILGRVRGDDPVEVVLGSTQERKFVALYHHDGIVSAALGLNLPKPLMAYRALLGRRAPIDEARVLARSQAG